nr:unnamed protein product [Digitaria exilis]
MKKCPSELQLEAFIRESGEGAGGAARSMLGRGEDSSGGLDELGGSGVFSPGIGFGDSRL